MNINENTVVIACMMIEDEVNEALRRHDLDLPIMWVNRGFHDKPARLCRELQHRIDLAEERGYTRILLAFGLCGGGVAGLKTKRACIAIPKFDDCINLMLCTGRRCRRGYAKGGVMYLTRGWCADEAARIPNLKESYIRQFGERRGKRLLKVMYDSYHTVCMVDTESYPLGEIEDIALETANELGLELRKEQGSVEALEKLFTGNWDSDILVVQAGGEIQQSDFNWELGD